MLRPKFFNASINVEVETAGAFDISNDKLIALLRDRGETGFHRSGGTPPVLKC
jgi:hypothetical protein